MEGLCGLLGDPSKMALFHHVCQLLPEETQAEFDRVAATRLGVRGQSSLGRTESEILLRECILEDTAIGSVGEYGGDDGGLEEQEILVPLQEEDEEGREGREEGEWAGKKFQPEERGEEPRERVRGVESRRGMYPPPTQTRGERERESVSCGVVGQTGRTDEQRGRGTSTPQRRRSTEATPTATPPTAVADITSFSTPGIVPPPPPTPAVGPGGVPLPPPPPPPSLSSQPHMKRVNWQKMTKTDGTVWGEVGLIPMFHTAIPQISHSYSDEWS